MSEVMLKNYLRQNCLFLYFMAPGGQTIDLRSNLTAHSGRAVNGLSFAFFPLRSSSTGSRARASEVENCRNGNKSATF